MKYVPINTSTDTRVAFHINKDVHAHHKTHSWFFADLFLVSLTDLSVSALLSWTHSDNEIMFFSFFFLLLYILLFLLVFRFHTKQVRTCSAAIKFSMFQHIFFVQSFRLSHRLRMRRYFFVCTMAKEKKVEWKHADTCAFRYIVTRLRRRLRRQTSFAVEHKAHIVSN